MSSSGISWAIVSLHFAPADHASTSLLSFLRARCPSCHPANSVKALKAQADLYNDHKMVFVVLLIHLVLTVSALQPIKSGTVSLQLFKVVPVVTPPVVSSQPPIIFSRLSNPLVPFLCLRFGFCWLFVHVYPLTYLLNCYCSVVNLCSCGTRKRWTTCPSSIWRRWFGASAGTTCSSRDEVLWSVSRTVCFS